MLFCPWNSPGKNTGVGCHSFLQEIFPTQGSNLGLLHCRQILYLLSHQGLYVENDKPRLCIEKQRHHFADKGLYGQSYVFSSSHVHMRSVQFSRSVVSDSLQPHESQHARPPCPSSTPRVHPDSRPLSHWCHPAISSSVVPFSSCPQSLPASEIVGP